MMNRGDRVSESFEVRTCYHDSPPRVGDWVELFPGWMAASVERVVWMAPLTHQNFDVVILDLGTDETGEVYAEVQRRKAEAAQRGCPA